MRGTKLLGILLCMIADSGPDVVVNYSSLDEMMGLKLAVSGMTAMGLGSTKRGLRELHGPISVPDSEEVQAFYFPFLVSGAQSEDERIRKHGRECAFFLIFQKGQKSKLLKYYEMIERIFRIQSLALLNEDDLNEPRCERLVQIVQRLSEGTSNELLISKEIDTGMLGEIPEDGDEQIDLLRTAQEILSEELQKLDIDVERTPVLKNAKEPDPLGPADLEVIEASSLMIKLLRAGIRHDPKTLRAVLSSSLLIKTGNFLLWRAREMKSLSMIEQASQAFQAACSLQESAILRFSIAACLLKMRGSKELFEKAGNNLEQGFNLKAGEKFNYTFILNPNL
ncbi:MAG: hypothetical protein ACXADX_00285 [Candidatus Hodarchaeales archaeon]|jgi:hypothetical protein